MLFSDRSSVCEWLTCPRWHSASEMTYIVSGGALNSTHSLDSAAAGIESQTP